MCCKKFTVYASANTILKAEFINNNTPVRARSISSVPGVIYPAMVLTSAVAAIAVVNLAGLTLLLYLNIISIFANRINVNIGSLFHI